MSYNVKALHPRRQQAADACAASRLLRVCSHTAKRAAVGGFVAAPQRAVDAAICGGRQA